MSFANIQKKNVDKTQLEKLNDEIQTFTQLLNSFKHSNNNKDLILKCNNCLSNITNDLNLIKPLNENENYQISKLKLTFKDLKIKYIQLDKKNEFEEDETTPLILSKFNNNQLDSRLNKDQLQIQMQIPNQIQLQPTSNEILYHEDLINERGQTISNIQQGVQDINQIFKTLDKIVIQQGEQINSIEDNIGSYAVDTHLAMGELNRANEYQKKKSKWCFLILLILIVIFTILLIAII